MIDLKKIRKSSGLTQKELAEKLGMKQQQYARYEVGATKLSFQTILKILEICGYELKLVKKS